MVGQVVCVIRGHSQAFISNSEVDGHLAIVDHTSNTGCTCGNEFCTGFTQKRQLFVSFRGSDSQKNFLTDADVAQVDFPICELYPVAAAKLEALGVLEPHGQLRVHRGVFQMFRALVDEIRSAQQACQHTVLLSRCLTVLLSCCLASSLSCCLFVRHTGSLPRYCVSVAGTVAHCLTATRMPYLTPYLTPCLAATLPHWHLAVHTHTLSHWLTGRLKWICYSKVNFYIMKSSSQATAWVASTRTPCQLNESFFQAAHWLCCFLCTCHYTGSSTTSSLSKFASSRLAPYGCVIECSQRWLVLKHLLI